MPLQTQTYRLNMGQGLEQKTDAKTLSSGKMLVLQNAKFTQANRLSKRDGFAAVGVANSGDSIGRLDSFNGAVIGWGDPTAVTGFITGTWNGTTRPFRSVYLYNEALASPTFQAAVPAFSDCSVRSSPIANGQLFTQRQADSASAGGFTIYGYLGCTAGGNPVAFSKIIDTTTGQDVIKETLLPFSSPIPVGIACVAAGTRLFCVVSMVNSVTQGVMLVNSYDTANAFTNVTNSYTYVPIFNATAFNNSWDVASFTASGTSIVLLAYQSGPKQITFSKLNFAGALLSTVNVTTSTTLANTIASSTAATATNFNSIGIVQPCPGTTSTTFKALYADQAGLVYYVPLNTSLTLGTIINAPAIVGSTTITMLIGQELSNGDTLAFAGWTKSTTTPVSSGLGVTSYKVSGGTISYTGMATAGQVAIASKPVYRDDQNVYFWSYFPSASQGQYILQHSMFSPVLVSGAAVAYSMYPAARILAGEAMSGIPGALPVRAANTNYISGTTTIDHSAIVIGQQYTLAGAVQQLPALSKIRSDFSYKNAFHVATLNNQAVVGGGFVGLFDGIGQTELGFFTYPEAITTSSTTSTGALMGQGLYQYVALYSWLDNQGNLHRSETSVPVSITTTASLSNNVTITVPYLGSGCTAKGTFGLPRNSQPKIEIYRTTVNANPAIFYRVDNDAVFSTTAFLDTAADTAITANEILYTQGGVLDNFTIDGSSVICAGPDRLFAASPNNNGVIMVGQPYTQTNGLSFFAGIQIQLPTNYGPITNMQYMDTTLVVFFARAIFAIQGQGPTANGQNNGFTQPQKVTDDVGCDNAHAAALYPEGILFKSAKGYYRLGRDLSFAPDTNYIGKAVESFNGFSCLRAVAHTDRNQCRFLLSDNATILVFDYFFQQWSTIQTSANDIAVVGADFYMANATPANGALVVKETVGTFTDATGASTGIPFNITTGWIALNQLQDIARIYRVRLLGDLKSTHTLKVELAYDFEGGDSPTFAETHTITSANITSNGSAYQCETFPIRQKCEAIAIRISDVSPTGESFDLTDIELECGVYPGRSFPIAYTKGF